jgi:hypothetical protein
MVEVFKTNVQKDKQAKSLVNLLYLHFPNSKINFDLDDCDKILRVEGRDIAAVKVMELVKQNGFYCTALE